ncbi:protease modulator HflC [Altererythrobacter litoralis]|uniref:Protein HflC n=1 Tax=Altererythrobacter litoralis TaxID=3113904 RepID=A0ABU7GHC3_9SPHN|nr:protease modulator HflC [Erythrobacteraceae bacterium 1XM1-14]
MESIWQHYKAAVIAIIALAAAAFSSLFIVSESEQAVIIRTGEPYKVVNIFRPNVQFGDTKAGLYWRIPFVDRVQIVERRILDLDMERQEVLTNDQQRLQVDAYARYRIIDPVQMIENAGAEENVRVQLAPIFTSVLRQELGRRSFASLLTAERGNAMTNIRLKLDEQARQYGAQVIDVQIKRADLPEGTPLQAAFTRMQSDRSQEAETIRAQGRKNAQIVRAEAEANAASTYAAAYGKDPEFYDFYRAMESYRRTFEQGTADSSMILSEDSEYFRQFRGRR